MAVPAEATGSSQPATIIDALAASAANNPAGSATDDNWNDLDILPAAAAVLPFDGLTRGSPIVGQPEHNWVRVTTPRDAGRRTSGV